MVMHFSFTFYTRTCTSSQVVENDMHHRIIEILFELGHIVFFFTLCYGSQWLKNAAHLQDEEFVSDITGTKKVRVLHFDYLIQDVPFRIATHSPKKVLIKIIKRSLSKLYSFFS